MSRTFASIAIAIFLSTASETQAGPAQGPEYIGMFEARSEVSDARILLERQVGAKKVKLKAFGYGGSSTVFVIAGARSPVRFRSSDRISFVVRVSNQDEDPNSSLRLYILKSDKGARELEVGNYGFSGTQVTINASMIAYTATKYGEKFFRIIPTSGLAPGEYTLMLSTSNEAFCFGVDP